MRKVGIVLLVLFLLSLPWFASEYYLRILISVGIGAMLAFGVRLIYMVGRLTLGHAAFMGLGAYTSALLATKLGVNFWLGLPAAGMVAALIAAGIGIIVLRIAGIYFVIVSFAFAEFLRYLWMWWEPMTGGITGILNIPTPSLPGIEFGVNPVPFYYLILFLVALTTLVMYRVDRSRVGMAFRAIGQNDVLAEHLGINLTRYRILAFTIACFFAGLAGSFQAHYHMYTSPEDFTILESLYAQLYPFVGGIGSLWGSLIGPLFMIGVSEGFRVAKELEPLFFGGVLILVMLFLPRGLVSLPDVIRLGLRKLAIRPASASETK